MISKMSKKSGMKVIEAKLKWVPQEPGVLLNNTCLRCLIITRASSAYNCDAAYPACCKRRLLGTHHWQSALLLVGPPVSSLHS